MNFWKELRAQAYWTIGVCSFLVIIDLLYGRTGLTMLLIGLLWLGMDFSILSKKYKERGFPAELGMLELGKIYEVACVQRSYYSTRLVLLVDHDGRHLNAHPRLIELRDPLPDNVKLVKVEMKDKVIVLKPVYAVEDKEE